MSLLSRLFGKKTSGAPAPEAERKAPGEAHKGFTITATPIREGGQYRVSAKIEKDGQEHVLVRADTMASLEDATAISLNKARQIIDEQGERIFAPR